MAMTRPGFWRDLWALVYPYWKSEEKGSAWLLLLSVIALTLGLVGMEVMLNKWNNAFFNTLQDKNKAEFYRLIGQFSIIVAVYIVVYIYSVYLNQWLQIRWRRWLTDRYLKEWLAERTYYRMQLTGTQTDNPDQRISEDLNLFVDSTLDLVLGGLNAAVTLFSFLFVLWGLSGGIEFTFGGATYELHGFMVWAALAYAAIGTWITHKIGKPLISLNFYKQRYEADFRFALARFRENTEGVALYRGEQDELTGFKAHFRHVVENWWSIMKRMKLLNTFRFGYNQAAVIFPYLAQAPRYFVGSGGLRLGDLTQSAGAFGQVQGALSWFINVYALFAQWRATVDRLTGFHNTIARTQEEQRREGGVRVEATEGAGLEVANVELGLPSGETLVSNASAQFQDGARVLIHGPAGIGKSTLFRAIAGIWPFGKGRVRVPKDFRPLFLPQRPYFPLGTLRQAVSYPATEGSFTEEQVQQTLVDVGLPQLAGRLDEVSNWSMHLSGGEQQRVAFARALLHRPNWLFLDEATSNLDAKAEAELYRLLTERLAGASIVSISHRLEVASFHNKHIELRPRADGSASLSAAPVAA